MKKKSLVIVILLAFFVLLSTGCDNKAKKNYNGIFKKDNITIKIYAIFDNYVKYIIENNGKRISAGNVVSNENKYYFDALSESISFSLSNSTLDLESNYSALPSGKYQRVGNYTVESLYDAYYGRNSNFNSNYQGEYTNSNNDVIKVYQPEDGVVVFSASIGTNSYDCTMYTSEQGYSCEIDGKTINIKSTGEKIDFSMLTGYEYQNNYSVYNRTKKFTKNDIVENFEAYYQTIDNLGSINY